MDDIRLLLNRCPKTADARLAAFTQKEAERAQAFHESFPQYEPTPLVCAGALAPRLGGLWVKDESKRFGLNAFKVLGSSYAIMRTVAERLSRAPEETDYAFLTSDACRKALGPVTFFTATDGNHGRGVAWAARALGQRAVVLMPQGTASSRFEAVRREGAEVTIEPMGYDDCVRKAALLASQSERAVLMQDTAWPGYETIPQQIQQGYLTMAKEADDALAARGVRPTHIFLQAGVGSMAAAVAGYFCNRYFAAPPRIVLVECRAADCFYRSAEMADGAPHAATGKMDSCMAGLCCGEPSVAAWALLQSRADAFASCADRVTEHGMRLLAKLGVTSGESGAVTAGLCALLSEKAAYRPWCEALALDENAQALCFSTEGDTDPAHYRAVLEEKEPAYE